jgi:alpha-L-rhamnosidase
MYQYNGDKRILEQHYSGMVKLMDRFAGRAKNNLLHYGLDDWMAIKKTPREYTINASYYQDALVMAQIATMLKKPDDVAKYTKLAGEIHKAYNDELFDKTTGLYKANTQTAQCAALYQGLADDEDRQKIFDGLIKLLADNKDHPNTGVFGAHFMPRVLSDFGKIDLALKMMTQPSGPGWGEWIARGYTTLQENWGRGDSQNHIFFGNISAWFYGTLAGIRLDPQQPAWQHIIVRPHPGGDLTWVKAQMKTIRGPIASSWKIEGNNFDLTVTIPANCTATVYVPVTAGNRAIMAKAQEDFTKPLGVKDGYEGFEVQSGTYEFRGSR